MSVYVYRCDEDGPVEIVRPIGTAPAVIPCPTCGVEARRSFTAPMLGRSGGDQSGRGERMAAIDRAEASRTEPTVVSAPPPRNSQPRRTPRLDPRTAALPRP
ncbi:zinc ribbon domain-containing protein [Actinomycetospora endophytica]|uniref:Zinc ribbon domain-containing protein n=1 Tax=Actinomycetospora endophytica TaxID=2291215 RepID=A0ABS8PE67_9PSEU|nr:zinc ribbon domain-containing protein [Actinomycetospora endophytica]MCD2196207.1 zinc ribbon domain-containing protein [Actinomycetospora endophytica]